MGGTIPGQVVPVYIRKPAKHESPREPESEPVSDISPWFLNRIPAWLLLMTECELEV